MSDLSDNERRASRPTKPTQRYAECRRNRANQSFAFNLGSPEEEERKLPVSKLTSRTIIRGPARVEIELIAGWAWLIYKLELQERHSRRRQRDKDSQLEKEWSRTNIEITHHHLHFSFRVLSSLTETHQCHQ